MTDVYDWFCEGEVPNEPIEGSNVIERLRQVLSQLNKTKKMASGDIAGLVRHLVREAAMSAHGSDGTVRVPASAPWPTQAVWNDFGFDIEVGGADYLRLKARCWKPGWLPGADLEPPFACAFAGERRRPTERIPCDPGLASRTGFTSYRSLGQRAAVRAAFFTPPGASVLVILPTGGGKSLAAYAPALLAPSGKTVVVVVPTVALALDQEKAYRRLLGGGKGRKALEALPPLAYYGDLGDEKKREMRQRLAVGAQPILFAAPESFERSLRIPLFRAARAGRLSHLVIDEAHLVSQWGKEFRPDFQLMAPLRRALLAECPPESRFRTLLMSATITEEAWHTLDVLFAAPEPLAVVSAVHLRPEPSYWAVSVPSPEERQERIQEVIRHAPRPLILYVSRREDAKKWKKRIQAMGIERVGLAIGNMVTNELIESWGRREIDVMVANSAFGLGVDNTDVQAVIHACLPETIDRYYQEVGRGGRDGRASVAILVHEPGDDRIAKVLNDNAIIGVKLGLERWTEMFRQSDTEGLEGGARRISVNVLRSKLTKETDKNVAWNVRTLILMVRAGLLQLETAPPPNLEQHDDEADEAYAVRREAAFEEYWNRWVVTPVHAGHALKAAWAGAVEDERARSKSADRIALARVKEVLTQKRPFHEVFRESYTIRVEGARAVEIDVETPSGRCPITRRNGTIPTILKLPVPPQLMRHAPVHAALLAITLCQPFLVTYSKGKWAERAFQKQVLECVQRLVKLGVSEVAAPPEWTNEQANAIAAQAPSRFVAWRTALELDEPDVDVTLPRISIASPRTSDQVLGWLRLVRSSHIVLTHEDTLDEIGRNLCDRRESISFEAFARKVERCPS